MRHDFFLIMMWQGLNFVYCTGSSYGGAILKCETIAMWYHCNTIRQAFLVDNNLVYKKATRTVVIYMTFELNAHKVTKFLPPVRQVRPSMHPTKHSSGTYVFVKGAKPTCRQETAFIVSVEYVLLFEVHKLL